MATQLVSMSEQDHAPPHEHKAFSGQSCSSRVLTSARSLTTRPCGFTAQSNTAWLRGLLLGPLGQPAILRKRPRQGTSPNEDDDYSPSTPPTPSVLTTAKAEPVLSPLMPPPTPSKPQITERVRDTPLWLCMCVNMCVCVCV